MSSVFLLSCNTATEPYPVYPLGMSVVAAGLQAAGHRVRQFDWLASGRDRTALAAALEECAPDYVGLSLRNIDNVDSLAGEEHWYLGQARELAAFMRGICAAPFVVGGPAFSIMPHAVLEFLGADYGVCGAGEDAMPELIAALENGEDPPRITWGRAGAPRLRPLIDAGIMDFYLAASGLANMQTKRGCPFRCGYCTYPGLEGGAFAFRPAKEVADEVLWLHREYGVRELFFTDSVFNDPQGRYLEIVEALASSGAPVRWAAFFRPQGLTAEAVRLLRKSGCMGLELGTDAASDPVLRGLNKGLDFDEVVRCDALIRESGLPAAHFLMFGGPDETPETLERGLKNLERLPRSVVFAFTGIRILSGTLLEQRAVREGIIAEGADLLRPVYYFSPYVEPGSMNALLKRAFRGNRLRLFPPAEAQLRMDVMRRFGQRGLLWDKLLG